MFQTGKQQEETLGWAVLATFLNGGADSGKYQTTSTPPSS